jgi:hypothetical protein
MMKGVVVSRPRRSKLQCDAMISNAQEVRGGYLCRNVAVMFVAVDEDANGVCG